MATRVLKTIEIYRQKSPGGLMYNREPGEEASMSWTKGTPLVEDGSTSEMEEWAGGADNTEIIGVAAKDATGTAGSEVPYYEANDTNLFAASLIDNTSAVAFAHTHLKSQYSLIKSGNDWYVDVADSGSNDKVEVVEGIDDIGDTNARVVIRFCPNIQANVNDGTKG